MSAETTTDAPEQTTGAPEAQNPEQTPETKSDAPRIVVTPPAKPETPAEPAADAKPEAPAPDSKGETSPGVDDPAPVSVEPPEGLAWDETTLAKVNSTAQELGLNGEQTQKLVEALAPELARENDAQLEGLRTDWAERVLADKDIGGDKLAASEALAGKVVETFGSDGLSALLDAEDVPLGKHPEVLRFLVKIGEAMSEAPAVLPGNNGGSPAPREGDAFGSGANLDAAAEKFYGKTN